MRGTIKKVMHNPVSKGLAWGLGLAAASVAAIGAIVYVSEKSASAAPSPAPAPAPGSLTPAQTAQLLTTPVAQTPSQYATPAQVQSLIQGGQNALVVISSGGKVSGLSYTTAQANTSAGNASDPTFVQQLAIFQAWVNSAGGYMPPAASGAALMQLNTQGVLDYATLGALVTVAAGNAPNLPTGPTPAPITPPPIVPAPIAVTLPPSTGSSMYGMTAGQNYAFALPANSTWGLCGTSNVTGCNLPAAGSNTTAILNGTYQGGGLTLTANWQDSAGNSYTNTITITG
jgi:hypothetical protein